MGGLWDRLEARLRVVDPDLAGLGSPAPASRLEAFGVPMRWRDLWGGHDGQTGALDGLFEGWFFLPLEGTTDCVREELERLPANVRDAWFPLAKDFSGEVWVIERATDRVLHVEGDQVLDLVATGPQQLLARAVSAWERDGLPRTWSVGPDGRWQRDGEPEVVLSDLGRWEVGDHRPLVEGLVAVRVLATAVLDPDDLPDDRRHRVFQIDAAEGSAPRPGAAVHVAVEGASIPLCSRGDLYWLDAERVPASARLRIRLDLERRRKPGPLERLAAARTPHDKATALHAIGAISRAVEALGATRDATLETALLLQLGRMADALAAAEALRPGTPARIRALSATGHHAEAIAEVQARMQEPIPSLADRWLAAEVLEAGGDAQAAAATLEAALDELPGGAGSAPRVVARIRSLRGRMPVAGAPPVLADGDLVVDVTVGPGPVAVVRLTPRQAEAGVLVQVPLPEGPLTVRLPKAAGHGARARFAPGGRELVVEVQLRPPPGWAPAAGAHNPTLAFDRWDVIAAVDPAGPGRLTIAALDATHEVEWPGGGEVRVAGAGLVRPGGLRGDLVVRTSGGRR